MPELILQIVSDDDDDNDNEQVKTCMGGCEV